MKRLMLFGGVYSGHLDFNDTFTMDGKWTQVFVTKITFKQLLIYHKIPKISPGTYIFQRPFSRGL